MQQPRLSKLPSDFSLEELLEAANGISINIPTNTQESNDIIDHDVFSFINALKILPGTKKVQKRLLYTIYRNWSTNPVTKVQFSIFICSFFEYNQYYYFLNLDALQIVRIPYKSIRKEKVDKTKSKNYKRHFESFLSFYELKSGTFYVEPRILYFLYDKWTYNNHNKHVLGFKHFLRFLNLYFDKKRLISSKLSFFGINEDIKLTHLNNECLETAEKWARKANEKYTKKYKENKASKKRTKKTNSPGADEISGSFNESEPEK